MECSHIAMILQEKLKCVVYLPGGGCSGKGGTTADYGRDDHSGQSGSRR